MGRALGNVIGSGLIASAVKKYEVPSDVIVFASGVSDSRETNPEAFEREISLLKRAVSEVNARKVVYFSTCSVYQSLKTEYIKHKVRMEEVVSEISEAFNIFRLPQVVGAVNNKTLVSHIVRGGCLRQRLIIQAQARRNLIDVDDVAKAVSFYLLEDLAVNEVRNLAALYSVSVIDIVQEISRILGIDVDYEIVSGGDFYHIPVEDFMLEYQGENYLRDPDYWKKVLEKNVWKISSLIL